MAHGARTFFNRLPWALDVSFREGASRIRAGDGAEHMGLLRRIALNLPGQEPSKQSLQGKRAGWDNAYLEKVFRI